MKKLLFAVFENEDETVKIITRLAQNGINGNALESASLKKIYDSSLDDGSFISLRHISHSIFEDNATFFSVLDDDKLKIAEDIIREMTDSFKKIRGGMFVIPIEHIEGSF